MARKGDFETWNIAKRLLIFLPAFYICFFIVSIIVLGAAREPITVRSVFTTPFTWASFTPAGSVSALVPFVALLVNFIVCGPILVYAIVAVTKQCWDFVATVTLLHWVLTCLVTLAFPLNYVWWVVFLSSGLLMSTFGELSCYYLRDMREIEVNHT
ncbi:integral membrane protein S linking to the trans Golgi network-domain-containing protein [Pavlovales sp. CCMP2436]|nr:integral membrane protein S linking to the trans Golgi network-domain-containing protein [Pavlovales sp. CCMP2436]|mmetsp:Transcript_43126/g.106486  ORF Transcript_43126/g.106486 Transcript_43126/m.106486 type:complete len:156 (-) Transcript_43126:241-708(-)